MNNYEGYPACELIEEPTEVYDVKCPICGDYRVMEQLVNSYDESYKDYLCKCGHEWVVEA